MALRESAPFSLGALSWVDAGQGTSLIRAGTDVGDRPSSVQDAPAEMMLRTMASRAPSIGNPIWTGRVVPASPDIHEDATQSQGKERALP